MGLPRKNLKTADRRRLRLGLVLVAGAAIIFSLVVGGVYFWATERVPGYRTVLQSSLSSELGLHVRIGSLDLSWKGLQPRLLIRNVEMQTVGGKRVLHLQSALATVGWRGLLSGSIKPERVELVGLHLYLDRKVGRQLFAASLLPEATTHPTAWLAALWRLTSLTVRQGIISIDSAHPSSRSPWVFRTTLRLVKALQGFRIQVDVAPPSTMSGEARLRLQIHGNPTRPRTLSGQWTASMADLRSLPLLTGRYPASALNFDQGRVHMTGTIERGRIVRSALHIQARAVEGYRAGRLFATARNFDVSTQIKRVDDSWKLDEFQIEANGVRGRWSAHANGSCQRFTGNTNECTVDVPHLALADVVPWLSLWPRAMPILTALPSLHGDLDRLQVTAGLRKDVLSNWHLSAELHDVGWSVHGSIPGVQKLSGAVAAAPSGGDFVLAGPAPTFFMPSRFAAPVKFSRLSGTLHWVRQEKKWIFDMPNLEWQILGMKGNGQVDLALPVSNSTLQNARLGLDLKFTDTDVARLKPLIPLQWGKGLRNWLRQSVIQTRLVAGNARYDGPVQEFPFGDSVSGRFAMDLQLDKGILQYAAKWPPAEHLTANLRFRGNGLDIKSGYGTVGPVTFSHVKGGISDFRDERAAVVLSARGDAKDFYTLLNQSPMRSRLAGLLNRTTANGPAAVNLKVTIPLRHGGAVRTSGRVKLLGATLRVHGLQLPLTHFQGDIDFDNSGVRATKLKAVAGMAVIHGSIIPEPDSPAGVLLLHAVLNVGRSSGIAASVLPHWINARMQGASDWQARLPLSGKHAGRFLFRSNLVGTSIALPSPLGKSATDRVPVTVAFDTATAGKPERMTIRAKSFGLVTWLVRSGSGAKAHNIRVNRIGLRLGPGPPPIPRNNEIRISGEIPKLDLLRVAGIFRSRASASRVPLGSFFSGAAAGSTVDIGLRIGQLSVGHFQLQPIQFQARMKAGEVQVKVTGSGANGNFRWGLRRHILYGRLAHVSLLPITEGTNRPDTGRLRAIRSKPTVRAVSPPIDPGRLPALDWIFAKVRIGSFQFGQVRILTRRITQGQKIQVLTISGGKNIGLNATGEWLRRANGSSAKVTFALHVNRLARVLKAFGYLPTVTASSAKISGHLIWPSAESGIDLVHAEGRVRLDINNGILKAVHPGAERVLGLLNLYALPRRLMFNFKDIEHNGLAFDHIGGSFQLGQGKAKTTDLTVNGPALRMTIHGLIGLAHRDFNETVTVYPNISTGITLGATLLGGPIAGGIALLSQQLFGQQMNSLASFSYRVTGGWNDPVLTRIRAIKKEKETVNQKGVGVPTNGNSNNVSAH